MIHHVGRRATQEGFVSPDAMARGIMQSLLWHSGTHATGEDNPLVTLLIVVPLCMIFGPIIFGLGVLLFGVVTLLSIILLLVGGIIAGFGYMAFGIMCVTFLLWGIEKIKERRNGGK